MTDEQKIKILDVMHTLSCIRDGKVVDARKSAEACWNVLDEVYQCNQKAGKRND